MDDEQPTAAPRRRGMGAEATARSEALERLKAVKRGGWRSEASGGYVVKVDQPIYDTVPEEVYEELVKKRREDVKGFIVDDNGLGYGDEGEEEDWTQGGFSDSYSDEEGHAERQLKRKRNGLKGNEKEVEKKRTNPALSAAAAMMGKQRISAMFTSTVFNNKDSSNKIKATDCDSILNDVIAEFAPDEGDRERRKRVVGGGHTSKRNISENAPSKVKSEIMIKDAKLSVTGNPVGNKKDHGISPDNKMKLEVIDETHRQVKESGSPVGHMEHVTEVKLEPQTLKVEEIPVLNDKVLKDVNDFAPITTPEWQGARNLENEHAELKDGMKKELIGEELTDLLTNADGCLQFFILDAYEEMFGANAGVVYLFGKVCAGNTYHSCCIVVKNMQRCIYAVPNWSMSTTEEILKLEKEVDESKLSTVDFRKKLQDLAYDVKNDIAGHLVRHNLSNFTMTPVKRKHAFERSDVPLGENYVIKINYPFKNPPIPEDLRGEKFSTLLGTHSSALELFLVKRKVKGPSWLSISNYTTCLASQRVSWCKFEISVNSSKEISVSSSKTSIEIPPVVVTAINLKTVINEKQSTNEIVSASIIYCRKTKIDGPMLASEWKKPELLGSFSVVRKLAGIFPMGFNKEASERNTKAGTTILAIESSERALINRLMIELHKLDSDVIVGHNICGFDLDVLLQRAQACRVPSSAWSKLGRLKRHEMPKIKYANSAFGSGASPGIMSCIAGRLLCDTYLCSRDLLKEVSYSLTHLAKSRLSKERKEISPSDIANMFQTSSGLMGLIECGETDGWLSLELMFHMSVLPLTRQLTNISGNLWGRTLQGARAQRVEYLLLHAFYAKKYILPEKIQKLSKDNKSRKRINGGLGINDCFEAEDDAQVENSDYSKSKRSPAYSGGLVLEPKKGLYDKFVLLLDFNSLYPSIIQEYNICFTTVCKSEDGTIPQLPSSKLPGILPELLKNLVQRRRMVKSWMKTASGIKQQQLDIQQQALKLTANSIYGCLGFPNSRFYAKPLAELITLQGREILQSTVDLVQNNLNLEVIYGDTDSIMIYSGVDDISKAKVMAGKVIQEVNKKYKCLEIDLDGLYARMLLLKKKKYAAVKLEIKDSKTIEVIERKGLDMVRRDWSLISKEIGDYCLSQILSGGSCEEVVESMHASLMKVKEEMRRGEIPLEKYVITKSLTKPPEAYTDAKNQPHVQVALRLKQKGYTSGFSAGDTVPYIICSELGDSNAASSLGIAQRARHPDELAQDDGKWRIDVDYYLSQQIHPVVSRLCASIQGTSPERLADCLGLDSSKYQIKSKGATTDDSAALIFGTDDIKLRYSSCDPMVLSCPSCSNTFECPPISTSVCARGQRAVPADDAYKCIWLTLRCPRCPDGDSGRISPAMLANQVKRQADGFVSKYYKGWMTCDDETCKYATRCVNLRVVGDNPRGTTCPNHPRCCGHLVRKYTEADLYKQLAYFCHVLDTSRCLEKMDASARIPFDRELAKIRPFVAHSLSIVQRMKDRCGYGWVRLHNFVVSV